jgi:hypothetical protein
MRCKKKIKIMPKKMLCQAGMMWQFGRIAGCHTSWRILGWNIFST